MALTKLITDLIDGDLGGGTTWVSDPKTANFPATAGEGYFVNTTNAAITVTLPGSPTAGDEVSIIDYGANALTNNITITSSDNIEGAADDVVINYNKGSVNIVYSDATKGWLVKSAANETDTALGQKVYASAVEAYNDGNTTDGFYDIQVPGWTSPKSVYCDMTNDGGGWMLWGQRLSSSPTIDIRYSGTLIGFTADATKGYLDEFTNLTQSGFIDLWKYFDGTKSIRWYNNITGNTSTTPGSFSTKVLIAGENGTSINNANYANWGANSGTATCPLSTYKYSFNSTYTDAGWNNSHLSGGTTCSGWGYEASNYIGNWYSNTDCGACYSPYNVLFGNGASAYYCCGNTYDMDFLNYDLTSTFTDVSISNHDANSNQLWVK